MGYLERANGAITVHHEMNGSKSRSTTNHERNLLCTVRINLRD